MTHQAAAPQDRRPIRIVYWVVTGLLCLNLFAGILDILVVDAIRQSTLSVGFPLPMLPFLGVLKILGALVLLFVKAPTLKIAAYAGVIFYFTGAVFAHLTAGQPFSAAVPALVTLVFGIGSFVLWTKIVNQPVVIR